MSTAGRGHCPLQLSHPPLPSCLPLTSHGRAHRRELASLPRLSSAGCPFPSWSAHGCLCCFCTFLLQGSSHINSWVHRALNTWCPVIVDHVEPCQGVGVLDQLKRKPGEWGRSLTQNWGFRVRRDRSWAKEQLIQSPNAVHERAKFREKACYPDSRGT